MPNVDVILVVKPDAFTDPASVSNMKFPRKFHAGMGSENNILANLRTKEPENPNTNGRTDLPRVCDENQLDERP